MSSLSRDNNANKRQRTDKVEDNRIVVNVGGKLFPTFRSTLTMKSTYFEKRLSGRFSDDAGNSEIIIDRDHEPFSIILSYLRSGKLLISPDKLLFGSILVEADFYGIDELVDMVRDKCYCNLNHIDFDEQFNEFRQQDCKRVFPSYEEVIEHVFFPSMYFNRVNYYRVISTHVLPENKFVRLCKLDDTIEFVETCQSITYECILTRTIFVEPLLTLIEEDKPSWLSLKSPTEWRDDYYSIFDRQQVPVSFWLGFQRDLYHKDWYTATRTEYKPDKNKCVYTAKIKNKPVTMTPDLAMLYTVNTRSDLNHTELYAYSSVGKLINVTSFHNYMHVGPKTDADTPFTPASEMESDSSGDLYTDTDDD